MKLYEMKCPYCGASLKPTHNITNMECPYCQGHIIIDDGVARTEHRSIHESYKESVNVNKSETRVVNDAKIIEAQNKRLAIKVGLIMFVIMLVLSLILGVVGYVYGGNVVAKQLTISSNKTKTSFQSAVLGQADKEMNLIVLKQELSVSSTITKEGWFDWGIFRKNKDITYVGTAIYTVNLKELRESDIVVNEDRKTVTIYAPVPKVYDITIDPNDFKIGDTINGFLSFGDIKFTIEEAFYIETQALSLLKEAAESEKQISKAKSVAEGTLLELFKKSVSSVDKSYKLIIEFE